MPDYDASAHRQKASNPSTHRPTATGMSPLDASLAHIPANLVQRAQIDPRSLAPADVIYLQRTVGNRSTQEILARQPIVQTGAPSTQLRSPVRPTSSTGGERRTRSGAPTGKVHKAPIRVQRLIDTKLPTKAYRIKGHSPSSRVNQEIDLYNANVQSGRTGRKKNKLQLLQILSMLDEVSSGKKSTIETIKTEIEQELQDISSEGKKMKVAVQEVMDLARHRAGLQEKDPRGSKGTKVDSDFLESLEVLHGTNPLAQIGEGRTVGDSLSESGEIKNVHQVGKSLIGKDTDSEKRKIAEMGLFYPEKYRRGSFRRWALENQTDTKGLHRDRLPPVGAFPKYGALNLSESPFGALSAVDDRVTNDTPLHFAISPKVLKERTTVTSSDSLRQWTPDQDGYARLQNFGMIPKGSDGQHALPTDDEAWNIGPIGTFDPKSSNMGQILDMEGGQKDSNGKYTQNPRDYIETQIHGELLLDRDVDFVRANFAKLFGNPGFASLYASLRASKKPIKWYYWAGETKDDNKVTQNWVGNEQRKFDAAWKEAEKVWVKSNKDLRAGAKDKSKLYKSLVEEGRLSKGQAPKLFKIWQKLQVS